MSVERFTNKPMNISTTKDYQILHRISKSSQYTQEISQPDSKAADVPRNFRNSSILLRVAFSLRLRRNDNAALVLPDGVPEIFVSRTCYTSLFPWIPEPGVSLESWENLDIDIQLLHLRND